MHLLSGVVVTQMVLNCWVKEDLLGLIKALKFTEQTGSNLVAVTNFAICANLALIVHVRFSIIFKVPSYITPGSRRFICVTYSYVSGKTDSAVQTNYSNLELIFLTFFSSFEARANYYSNYTSILLGCSQAVLFQIFCRHNQ